MKRKSNLFESIIDYQNINEAWLKSIKGKRKSTGVLLFSRNVSENLKTIRDRLISDSPGWGNYRSFIVTDPKKRLISAAPFEQRIMHHSIMNILEPIFERQLIFHCYACRKGKGMHAAVQYAFNQCKACRYFIKLDVRKYFDSIDHETLKRQLYHLIKDDRTLSLLYGIIDSYHTLSGTSIQPGKGLPIGNLTSQFFANLYLSCLDHYILEHLKPAGYVRYMDDFVLWHDDKLVLQKMFCSLKLYAENILSLELKQPVLGRTGQGLPFLGFLIKSSGIFLLRKSKRRMSTRAKSIESDLAMGIIGEELAALRAVSVNAAVILARCLSFRIKLWNGSGFGHEPRHTGRQLEQQCVQRHSCQSQ
ncbi:MAG: reverse transcriptase/maturase family protein [Brevinematales bacterium]|jgi:retron-type reverse transcriptase